MSSNKVGHASQNANWDLDVNSMPAVPFSQEARANWMGVLSHEFPAQLKMYWVKDVT